MTAFAEFLERYGTKAGEVGPLLFVQEVLNAVPDPWQEMVLRALGRGERLISVRSCHGPGKTAVAAWCVLYMLLTRFPQKTVATAPSSGQLAGALLPEVKTWFNHMPDALRTIFTVKAAGIYLNSAPSESFFEARTSRAEKPEALQGVHAENVLLIVDEASAVPEGIFESAIGSMSGEHATTLLISNPVRTSGFFYDTHHKLRDLWFTIHVSHADSPRVTDAFVYQVQRSYGERSNAFRVRCLGEFPRSDDDVLIPFELVESARGRDIQRIPAAPEVWGLDVARFGDDRNALVRRTRREVLPEIMIWEGTDLMQTTGIVKNLWDDTPASERPTAILVDVIGLGAGVVDRLFELGLPVRGVNVAEAASAKEQFLNARSELWWKCREWLTTKDVVLPEMEKGADPREDKAEQLCAELVTPKYSITSSGRIKLESKSEMKKRGFRSPDVADALILTFAEDLALIIGGSSGGLLSWNTPLERNLPSV